MRPLRILIVEDTEVWAKEEASILRKGLGDDIQIDVEEELAQAERIIQDVFYDLVVVDLALDDDPIRPEEGDSLKGMDLLHRLRTSEPNAHTGLIIVTGWPYHDNVVKALSNYGASGFIQKSRFDGDHFLEKAKAAIAQGRINRAEAQHSTCHRWIVTLDRNRLVGSQLLYPNYRDTYTANPHVHLDTSALFRRSNRLNLDLDSRQPENWREEARDLGREVYALLQQDSKVAEHLGQVRQLATNNPNIWIQVEGPVDLVGVPFELIRDERTSLARSYPLTRRIARAAGRLQPFHKFIASFIGENRSLRMLIVGASLPGACAEAQEIADLLAHQLRQLAIHPSIDLLLKEEATCKKVTELLNKKYHIIHFAGHCYDEKALPEEGGLVLADGSLTAAAIQRLIEWNDELRLVFLSCCLGAHTASQVGRGDLYSIMDGFVSTGVPIVLGYRWAVEDEAAKELALSFYDSLWRTLLPAFALRDARAEIAGQKGRDNATWASPVMVVQNDL
ncbi:MAG: CHAT domain-containing protein [Caldilineaceae bacterium]|nr:CHAT domain-containing protein [Caldilineaceae bacterium]